MVYINSIASAAFFALMVVAAPLERRDLKLVLADIKDVSAKTEALTASIDKYNGGILAALPVQQAESPLETSIKKAGDDVTAEPTPVSEDEARQVLAAIKELQPIIKKSTDGVTAKATTFGSLKGTVKSDMQRIKASADVISDGLVAKSPDSLKAEALAEKATFDGYFETAIKSLA